MDEENLIKCSCGLCDEKIPIYDKKGRRRYFYQGHQHFKPSLPQHTEQKNKIVPCKCGCGKTLLLYDDRGRTKQYLVGHEKKGRIFIDKWKKLTSTSHYCARARLLLPKTKCAVNNEMCSKKRLEIAHIDFDVSNNSIDNLVCLCSSHNGLRRKRKISSIFELKQLTPRFYIDRKRKTRRYFDTKSVGNSYQEVKSHNMTVTDTDLNEVDHWMVKNK